MLCCGAGGSSDNKVHDFTPEGSPSKKYEETPHPLDKSRASATNVYASMLTRGQEQEIQKVFARFDRDGNGTIEAKELEIIMNQMGSKPTAEQIADMIQAADADASGTIDYDEFLTMMAKRLIVANGKEELEMAFRRAPGPRAHAVAMPGEEVERRPPCASRHPHSLPLAHAGSSTSTAAATSRPLRSAAS